MNPDENVEVKVAISQRSFIRMVNIAICGPDDDRNCELITKLRKHCWKGLKTHTCILSVRKRILNLHRITHRQDFKCDERFYEYVLTEIVTKQCSEENSDQLSEYITDNCVISTLALAQACLGDPSAVERIVASDDSIGQSLRRYRSMLIILIRPDQIDFDDKIWLKLTQKGWMETLQTYKDLLNRFKIPFLDLSSADAAEVCDAVKDAIAGHIQLETSNLMHYEQIAKAEKNGSKNFEATSVQKHFLFFRIAPEKTDDLFVPTIKVMEHKYEQDWTVFPKERTNRFIKRHGHGNLVCVYFHMNVRSSKVQKMLLNGIQVNGDLYTFLGCSSSGLKDRKCFMWRGTIEDVRNILQSNGDFDAIKTISKRLSRIGLLFSAVTLTTVKVEDNNVIMMEDIEIGRHNFSDGCGLVGEKVARELFEQMKDDRQGIGYLSSVYQVRFQGYKGVLALDTELEKDKIAVRPSMEKFNTDQYPYIGVCGYSKMYTFGHLNKQFIQLLSGLGVPDKSFLQKQEQHFSMIDKMLTHSDEAVRCLQWRNEHEIAQRIVRAGGLDRMPDDDRRETVQILKKLQQTLVSKVQKLNIFVPKSRNIFGICDTSGTLDYGECFLRVTLDGKPKTIRGQVIVCKNPCYLLGDVRVLTAVDDTDKAGVSKLNHLKDCVVFPSKGKRPHADEIAGSDLDGDEYFVTWDGTLIPPTIRMPYDYPPAKTKPRGDITHESTIAYFSKQNETKKMIGKVNKFYNQWADLKNVTSEECELLGQLFSRVIDSGKSGEEVDIPKSLHPPQRQRDSKFVWNMMVAKATEFECSFKKSLMESVEDVSPEFVQDLVGKTYTNISEYEKFLFCWEFSMISHESQEDVVEHMLETYADKINFSGMSVEERQDVIEKGIPRKYVLNALNKSSILTEEDLRHFQMDSPFNTWGDYLALYHEEFDWSHLFKSLTTNDCNLLVLEMPDNVVIELQFLEKLTQGTEQTVSPGTISAVFYSKHFGYKYRYILGPEYVLDLTQDTLQLYRESLKNLTFVWLKATDRKATKGRWNKRVDDEVVNSLSVDLQRFKRNILAVVSRHPLLNKTPFVKMELYAQNYNSTEYPYWDSFDANDILPLTETPDVETENDEEYKVDFERLFPNELQDFMIDSDENFVDALGQGEENPHLFKVVLGKWQGRDMPDEIWGHFNRLLKHIIAVVAPEKLPENMQKLVTEIVVMISDSMTNPSSILSASSHLHRLGLADVASQLIQKSYNEDSISTQSFLSTVEDWQSFWFLDAASVLMFLQQLSTTVNRVSNQNVSRKQAYLYRLGLLHALALLEEVDQLKNKMTKATATAVSKESQTSVSFLKVVSSATNDGDSISFYRTCALEKNLRITQGQYVSVQRQNSRGLPLLLGQVKVLRLAPFHMTLKTDGRVPESVLSVVRLEGVRYFRADLIGNIVTYQRVIAAMKQLEKMDCDRPVFNFIANSMSLDGQEEPNSSVTVDEGSWTTLANETEFEELNEKQREAVSTSLQRNLCLIQGPPGTGKTKVACHIIKEIVLTKKYTGVLVVGETNIAVDNLARRLRKEVQIVRIGTGEGIAGDLYDVTLDEQVRKLADKEAKRSAVRDQHGDQHRDTKLVKRVLAAADVVLATCAGSGDAVLESCQFDFVLVDEATLTMETTMLCAMAHGVKHLVLIGDHKQLGPVIQDTMSTDDLNLDLPAPSELSKTLFHRLIDMPTVPSCFLTIQHRMHPEIMMFPSEEFYEGKLRAGDCVHNRLEIKFPWPQMEPYKPVCFVNVEHSEFRRGTSYCNMREADIVKGIVDVLLRVDEEALREYRIGVNQIAVLTLYQAQVAELKNKIHSGVAISSVDGFQGQERDVVVVSTVRCNKRQAVGFSGDPQRINVLLTRAKRGLVVVGNAETLKGSEIWSRWLQRVPVLPECEIKPVNPKDKGTKRSNGKGPKQSLGRGKQRAGNRK